MPLSKRAMRWSPGHRPAVAAYRRQQQHIAHGIELLVRRGAVDIGCRRGSRRRRQVRPDMQGCRSLCKQHARRHRHHLAGQHITGSNPTTVRWRRPASASPQGGLARQFEVDRDAQPPKYHRQPSSRGCARHRAGPGFRHARATPSPPVPLYDSAGTLAYLGALFLDRCLASIICGLFRCLG